MRLFDVDINKKVITNVIGILAMAIFFAIFFGFGLYWFVLQGWLM